MAQFHWDPDAYLALMREEGAAAAEATGAGAARILELGTGTGETARRVLARHPAARLTGIDASEEMLDQARAALPAERVDLRVGRLEAAGLGARVAWRDRDLAVLLTQA